LNRFNYRFWLKNMKQKITPLVSIFMITYNHENFISQALEGVLMQQVNFEYEIVLGEDFSTDNTRKIILEYAQKYPNRFKLILHDKNVGPMVNEKIVMNSCTGKYIAMCEGDDYWIDSQKLQKQVDFLEANSAYAGTAHQSTILIDNKESRVFRENVPTEITVHDLIGPRLFHTASVMFRTSVLDLFLKSPAVLSGDRLLNFCTVFTGKIRFSDDIMCVYRLHEAGISSNATLEQMKLDLNSVSYLKKIYPSFPKFHYLSYVYYTIVFSKDASLIQKLYYRLLSFIYSFSYFPENIKIIVRNLATRIRR